MIVMKQTKKPFDRCLVCGGEMWKRRLKNYSAVVKVPAYVCLRCGERLYSQETVRRFWNIREKSEFG